MIYAEIDLFGLDRKTGNDLTVCKQMTDFRNE